MSFDINYYKYKYPNLKFDNDYKYYINWLKEGIYDDEIPTYINDNLKYYKPDKNSVNNFFDMKKKKNIFIDYKITNKLYPNDKDYENYKLKGQIINSLIYSIIFPYSIIKYDDNNNFFIYYNNELFDLIKFTNTYMKKINLFYENYNIIDFNLKYSELVTIFHIANIKIGLEILKKLNNNYLIKNQGLIINLTALLDNQKIIIKYVKEHFNNYLIINIPNMGNDIAPSFIMYKLLEKYNIKYNYILKIHTKYDYLWRNQLLIGLTNNNNENLIKHMKKKNIGIIGSKKWYKNVRRNEDNNISLLNTIYDSNILVKSFFIGGTIFLCKKIIFEKVILNNQNLIIKMFLNSYYIQTNSPVHAIERSFGVECFKNNLPIHTFNLSGEFNFNYKGWLKDFDHNFYNKAYNLNFENNEDLEKHYETLKEKENIIINSNQINLISPNFDFNFYFRVYLKNKIYYDRNEIVIHFLNNLDNIVSLKDFYEKYPDFNYNFYINYINKKITINDEFSAIKHFIRKKKCNDLMSYKKFKSENNFNFRNYLNLNKDLVNCIDNEEKAIMHYIRYGKRENRKFN